MRTNLILCLFLYLITTLSSFASEGYFDYERKVEVPEPLFIDLVRSLDAKKGELEVNSLFTDYSKEPNQLNWAPEIEYTFLDGQSLELELPSQSTRLESYKVAYQLNLTPLTTENGLHGVQVIIESDKKLNHKEATLFHIYAYRVGHNISLLNIMGLKFNSEDTKKRSVLLNTSFFYNYSEDVDFGFETNIESSEQDNQLVQFIPQIHLAFNHGHKIQYGFGRFTKKETEGFVTSFRLIKEFNL